MANLIHIIAVTWITRLQKVTVQPIGFNQFWVIEMFYLLYLSCSHFMMPFRKSLQLLDRCWLPCLPIPTITLTVPGLRFTPSQSVRSTSQIINQHTPWHLTFKTYHSRFKTQCLLRISWKRRNEIKQTLWALNIIQFNGNAIILRNEIVELSTV